MGVRLAPAAPDGFGRGAALDRVCGMQGGAMRWWQWFLVALLIGALWLVVGLALHPLVQPPPPEAIHHLGTCTGGQA